jgi:hypothetical protein
MPTFHGSDFAIELPQESRDESTYAFTFPARSSFAPSVVIKTERLAHPTDLAVYVEQQLAKIQRLLPAVAVLSNSAERPDDPRMRTSVFDWGDPSRRLRQKQRYIQLSDPERVVTLTGTSLVDTFPETEALFDSVFASFRPTPQKTSNDGSVVEP